MKYTHLTCEQRYQIETYLKAKMFKKFICKELQISRSTLYRAFKRNKTKRGLYRANHANMLAEERKERYGRGRTFTSYKQKIIDNYITAEQWSAEQIVGYCKVKWIDMVSVERIYQYVREDRCNGGTLYKHMRHQLKHRKSQVITNKMRIKERVSIDKRPEKVNNREVFGHWEADLIVGKEYKGAI